MGVVFTVPGTPAPQGSKTPWGTESNPRTRPWRAAVSAEAAEQRGERALFVGPVTVEVLFSFTRPRSHFRSGRNSHLLRENAPSHHVGHPDLDKLQRAIGDSLTGVLVRDDKQIARWVAEKVYGDRAEARIAVIPLSREEHDGNGKEPEARVRHARDVQLATRGENPG